MPPPDANPSYILPSYFTKYHDSPHKWDEIAYLEHIFPEGVQITSSQYQAALNRWVGAIKWLKENSEHVEPASKLLEQHSDEGSRRRLKNWYSRKTRNGKVYKNTKKGTSVKVNRSTAAVHVEIQGASFHDVGHVNYGQNFINNDGNGSQSASTANRRSASDHDVGSADGANPLSASSCHIQGGTFHDVNHVNYGLNYINNNSGDQRSTSDSSDPDREANSAPASPCSPAQEASPASAYSEASDESSLERNSKSFTFSATGRVLADVIRDSDLPQAHIARAGIIVLYDEKVKDLFESSERRELVQLEPPLPELDDTFLDALKGYASDTTANQFRHTARTHPYRSADVPHDDSKHAQAEWVDMVVLWMLKLYSGYGDLRAHGLLEGWFDTCIWSVVFDLSTFGYKWMMPRRKEVQSWSLKSIAAQTEDPVDKSNKRSLYDGIIYDDTHFDHLEFGMFEVAKDFDSLQETKLVTDRRKLYKGMHGMGRLLSTAVGHDPETMKSVQVIGIQNMEFSFRIQVGTPISPEEIIISQGEVQSIPTTLDRLQNIFVALKSVGLAMAIMDRSEKAVERYLRRNTFNDPELFVEKLLKSGL